MANTLSHAHVSSGVLATNKLLRNTYMLLSLTLLFSALTAAVSMFLQLPPMTYLLSLGGAMLLMWLVLPRTANSAAGIGVVFAITGLMGLGLGPILSMYLSLPNGPQVVATALGGTGVIFLGLSGYALTTRRDFSFLGGFLFVGILVVFGAALLNIFLAVPAMSLALSAVMVMLMSGFILFDTSRMVNGGVDNYIIATVQLYVNIFNLFISLLQLLGFASND
ncbi:MAG: Bax inhibitor-1/YccA family protein [Gammaproteobacteria bacterium]|nr:Bax inhibitor-1/YccA family protein [Gammaproteobacteria bacterium]MCP5202476.1 Bax inhibitor-1/YccA family protein [Gammaproteobacteria bacterium]